VYVTSTVVQYENPKTTIEFSRSLNGGVTWSAPVAIGSDSSDGARAAVDVDGNLVILWVDRGRDQVLSIRSTDQGATFSSPTVVAQHADNLNTPPPGTGESSELNAAVPRSFSFPNFPSLAVDRSASPRRGRLYATWVQQASGESGPVAGTVDEVEPNDSPAQATTFSIGQSLLGGVPSSDFGSSTPDFFGFDGRAGQTVTLTGRSEWYPWPDFIESGLAVVFCPDSMSSVEMVRTSAVPMGGEPEPPMVLTLPSDGRYYVRMTGAKRYSVAYQVSVADFVVSPTSVARDHRDAVITWSDDGGLTWAPVRRVSDGPPGFTDALPEVSVDVQGRVHVAWYDFREESHCGSRAAVRWRMSTDGGLTFHPSQLISDYASSWYTGSTTTFPGWHMAMTTSGTDVHVAWVDGRDRELVDSAVGPEIYAASFSPDVLTATAISRFEGEAAATGVLLRWRIGGDGEDLAFRLHRAADPNGAFETLGMTLPAPDGRVERDYEITDTDAEPGNDYTYRLEIVKRNGESVWSTPITIALPAAIRQLAWEAPRPNPFGDRVVVALANPGRAKVSVAVHDLRGAVVAHLHDGELSAGVTRWSWNGRRTDGTAAAPGVYLLRATGGGMETTRRLVRVR